MPSNPPSQTPGNGISNRPAELVYERLELAVWFGRPLDHRYRTNHQIVTEEFIFEPRLEPGLPASTLAELEAANIQFLHVELGFADPVIHAVGLDQKMRKL